MEQTRSEILRTIPYGFYITGVGGGDGEANGFTTCWVSQISFESQQVVGAVRRDQHTHELMEQGGVFSARLRPRRPRPGRGDGLLGRYLAAAQAQLAGYSVT